MSEWNAILELLAEDKNKKLYRPRFAELLDSAMAAILLNEIIYWWVKMEQTPFYKFRDACQHEKYKSGESWCEDLGWKLSEFDSALAVIGTKIMKGMDKKSILETGYPERQEGEPDDKYMERFKAGLKCIVVYWTDSNRITWYQLNADLLGKYVERIYLDKCASLRYISKCANRINMSKIAARRKQVNTPGVDSFFSVVTQSETQIKEKDSADAGGENFSEFEDTDALDLIPSEIPDAATDVSPGIEEIVEPAIELVAAPLEASPVIELAEPVTPAKPARPVNPMYDAIFKVWKLAAGMNGDMQKLLEGTATKKGYKEYNLEVPITPDELLDWAAWWRHTELNGDTTKNMLGVREKIQSSITYWQMIGKPKAPTVPVKPEHQLFTAGDQAVPARPSAALIQDPRVRDIISQIAASKNLNRVLAAQGNKS